MTCNTSCCALKKYQSNYQKLSSGLQISRFSLYHPTDAARWTTAPKGPQRNGHSCHGNAGELQAHIKQEFRKAAGDEEVYGMKYRLSEGRVQLRQLSETLGMTSA